MSRIESKQIPPEGSFRKPLDAPRTNAEVRRMLSNAMLNIRRIKDRGISFGTPEDSPQRPKQ